MKALAYLVGLIIVAGVVAWVVATVNADARGTETALLSWFLNSTDTERSQAGRTSAVSVFPTKQESADRVQSIEGYRERLKTACMTRFQSALNNKQEVLLPSQERSFQAASASTCACVAESLTGKSTELDEDSRAAFKMVITSFKSGEPIPNSSLASLVSIQIMQCGMKSGQVDINNMLGAMRGRE